MLHTPSSAVIIFTAALICTSVCSPVNTPNGKPILDVETPNSAPLHNDTAQNAIARKVEIQSTYYSHAIDIGRFAPWDEKEISETDDLIRQFGRESIYPGGSWNSDDFVYGNFMTLQEARPITRRFTFQLILEALTQLKSAIEANGGKGGLVTVYDILSDGSKVKSALGSYWQSDYPVSYANSSAS